MSNDAQTKTQTLLGARDAAILAGITRDQLDRAVARGDFPAPAALIGRIRGWSSLQIIDWSTSPAGLQARRANSATAAGTAPGTSATHHRPSSSGSGQD